MTATYARLPNPVAGSFVTIKVEQHRLSILTVTPSPWWQFWRKKPRITVLGEVAHRVARGDAVSLRQHPEVDDNGLRSLVFTLLVNSQAVLQVSQRYPR